MAKKAPRGPAKKDFGSVLAPLRDALLQAQVLLHEEKPFAIALIVTGIPTAGRSETVNQFLEWLNPKYVKVHALEAPKKVSRTRPPLWRFWNSLPARGEIAIYFTGWYDDYLLPALFDAKKAARHERRAIERNRPRGWILDDVALREIVMRVPRTLDAFEGIPELQPSAIKHCGEELLALIGAAAIPDPPPPLNLRARPDPAQMALVKKLGALNQTIAQGLGLSPEVLATRRDIETLAEGGREVGVLQGWRRAVIGEAMLAAL